MHRWIDVKKNGAKFVMTFWDHDALVWSVESYIILSHEVMVAWIEQGIHPEYRYT